MPRPQARSIVFSCVLCGLGACTGSGGIAETPVEPPTGPWVDPGPFEATRVRVYPLTRIDQNSQGSPVIVLHFELTDRWGDPVKGVGELTVQAHPTVSVGESADIVTWKVPLWDGEVNASYYDPTSRTYRVELTELPPWMFEGGESSRRDARVKLAVVYRTPAVGNGERALRDELDLALGVERQGIASE